MNEIWKNIGFGTYQVSNKGRIRNKGKILKQQNLRGYKKVRLMNGTKKITFTVHRLVAINFVPNPNGYTEINHIDENKANNISTNLEWCTRKYNVNYGKRTDLTRKRTVKLDINGKEIKVYKSLSEAANETSINIANISKCCLGKRKTAGGYKWKYYN